MTFRLALKAEGNNPLYWSSLDQLIGVANISVNPDASYQPQSDVAKSLSGLFIPRGFPAAKWHFNALTVGQRQILKSFCPSLSAEVYFETLSNEISLCDDEVWIQATAILHWPAGDEEIQAGRVMGLELLFTHIAEI
jgi:hypothetical protein